MHHRLSSVASLLCSFAGSSEGEGEGSECKSQYQQPASITLFPTNIAVLIGSFLFLMDWDQRRRCGINYRDSAKTIDPLVLQGCSLPLNLHSNWIPIRFYAPWVIRRRCTRSYQWASFMLLFGVFLPSFLPPSCPSPPSSRWVFGVWKVLYVVYQPRAARQPAVANQLKSKWVINNEGFFHPLIWLVVQSRGIRCAAAQHHPLPIAIFKWVDGGWQYLSSATREFLSPPQTIWSGNTPTVIS